MTVEEIKHKGQIDALKRAIDHERFELGSRTFEGFSDEQGVYFRFGECLEDAQSRVVKIKELFAALRKLDPDYK